MLLWVNNHFNDFEGDPAMTRFLEEFERNLEDTVRLKRIYILQVSGLCPPPASHDQEQQLKIARAFILSCVLTFAHPLSPHPNKTMLPPEASISVLRIMTSYLLRTQAHKLWCNSYMWASSLSYLECPGQDVQLVAEVTQVTDLDMHTFSYGLFLSHFFFHSPV